MGAPSGSGPKTSHCDGKAAQNLASGGTVTASEPGDPPKHAPANVIDDQTGTKWSQHKNAPAWIEITLAGGARHVVTQYALSPVPSGTIGTDPVSFELEATNDGSPSAAWTTLDAQLHHRFVNRQATMWFSFANTTPYSRYRLSVTESGGGHGVEIAELQLFGAGTPVFSVDDAIAGSGLNQFQYSSGWEGHGTGDVEFTPPKYGSSSSWSNHKNESVSFAFDGSELRLYGVRYPEHGIAGVSIDGGPEAMVDFYGTASGNVLLYSTPAACPPRRQIVRIRTTGDKHPKATGTFISIDRVQIVP